MRQWRLSPRGQLPRSGWLPLNLLARHDLRAQAAYERRDAAATALLSDLAAHLAAWSLAPGTSRFRRIRTALDQRALERLAAGHAQPFQATGMGTLWRAWRAARGAGASG